MSPPPARVPTKTAHGELSPNRRTAPEIRGEPSAVFRPTGERIPEGGRDRSGDRDLSRVLAAAAGPYERTHRLWSGVVRGKAVRGIQGSLRDGTLARSGKPHRAETSR